MRLDEAPSAAHGFLQPQCPRSEMRDLDVGSELELFDVATSRVPGLPAGEELLGANRTRVI
jgi:hypothetical protein